MRALIGLLLLAVAACAPALPQVSSSTPEDQCAAAHYQYLIGKQKSEIPPTPAGARWRIACTTCMVTMDFWPGRLNIFYDEKTGVIEKVRCG